MKKKYLHEPKPGFLYVRIKGQYIGRITAERGTPEFDAQYWEILNGKKAASRTSFAELIKSYRKSDRWAGLALRTRKDYEKVLAYLEEKVADKDATRMVRKDIINAMQANAHRIRFANYIASTLSVLFEHAIDLGWRQDNPARGIRKLKVPDEKKKAHVPWTDEAVQRFRAQAAPLPRLIFELGLGSVQRPGDWVKFRWNDYDGECLRITQGKTGRQLYLPVTQQLKEVLDNTPRTSLTIIAGKDGRPMAYRRMAQIMRDERKRLDLIDFDLHALRYRGVMELAWGGCSDEEIASYSGHASRDMIAKYAGKARQITRARSALTKRSEQNETGTRNR